MVRSRWMRFGTVALACCPLLAAAQATGPIWTPDMPMGELMRRIPTREVPVFAPDTTADSITYLPNGLRKSTLLEPERWLLMKDEVEVRRVRIIFSKYPLRNGVFDGHYWLTRARLIELFRVDPSLNRDDITWEVVLHTDCRSDRQVATLFHGIEITHVPRTLADTAVAPGYAPIVQGPPRGDLVQRMAALLPDHPVGDTVPVAAQELRVEQALDSLLRDTLSIRGRPDEAEALAAGREGLKAFQGFIGFNGDSVVYRVLDRNPQWKRALVVADWTGSMYAYGAQALQWHMDHFQRSGLTWFTIFNDGDAKDDGEKHVGQTGGVYGTAADHLQQLLALYYKVMLAGSGGDGPENDIEAVLTALQQFPDPGEVILIADNGACIRDMELLDLVDRPVRVVVCGAVAGRVNEQLLQIALATGGSLHTIELDIHNAEVKRNARGEALSLRDQDMKFYRPYCNEKSLAMDAGGYHFRTVHTDLKEALKERGQVEALDLTGQPFTEPPRPLKRLEGLVSLGLDSTGLTVFGGRLQDNTHLRVLDVNGNALSELPEELAANRYLVRLNARDNRIVHVAPRLAELYYLKELDLSGNPLQHPLDRLPAKRLTTLRLARTGLTEWPVVVRRMRRLQVLDLSGNALTTVTIGPSLPATLIRLDLRDNALREVKVGDPVPANLREVDLRGDPLTPEAVEQLRLALPKVKFLY